MCLYIIRGIPGHFCWTNFFSLRQHKLTSEFRSTHFLKFAKKLSNHFYFVASLDKLYKRHVSCLYLLIILHIIRKCTDQIIRLQLCNATHISVTYDQLASETDFNQLATQYS